MLTRTIKRIVRKILKMLGLYTMLREIHERLTVTPQFHLTHSGIYKTPAKRSVIFLHNSYYHFHYLAQALRRRNWDVVTVSIEEPGVNHLFYHGEDINLYSAEPYQFRRNINYFFKAAIQRYKLLHFANDHVMSFYPENFTKTDPEDIIEWKKYGNKLAYTTSGCNSAISQTNMAHWSGLSGKPVCDICPWQNNANVCSDKRNLEWSDKIEKYCDVIFAEQLPALDGMSLAKAIREPMTMCLDPVVWHPELEIPAEYRIDRRPDEILIYHSVGNYISRTINGRNIKGTAAVIHAIEELQKQGYPVRLIFETDKPNKELRFTQVQADIIVDQLNIGRYGATAREAMMLGKPTICYINKNEPASHNQLTSLEEVPLISATEETIYAELKNLIENKERRLAIGKKSREFALKWHSADACAERYEIIYDQLMNNQELIFPQHWNYFEVKRMRSI